jgi:hypothetical protein
MKYTTSQKINEDTTRKVYSTRLVGFRDYKVNLHDLSFWRVQTVLEGKRLEITNDMSRAGYFRVLGSLARYHGKRCKF